MEARAMMQGGWERGSRGLSSDPSGSCASHGAIPSFSPGVAGIASARVGGALEGHHSAFQDLPGHAMARQFAAPNRATSGPLQGEGQVRGQGQRPTSDPRPNLPSRCPPVRSHSPHRSQGSTSYSSCDRQSLFDDLAACLRPLSEVTLLQTASSVVWDLPGITEVKLSLRAPPGPRTPSS